MKTTPGVSRFFSAQSAVTSTESRLMGLPLGWDGWAARAVTRSPARWTINGHAQRRRGEGGRAPLDEATQAGRDQAEVDRPALGEQHHATTRRRVRRADNRLTHGSAAYHRCH